MEALFAALLIIGLGMLLQYLATASFGLPQAPYRSAYFVMALHDAAKFAGRSSLSEVMSVVTRDDVIDGFYVLGDRLWFPILGRQAALAALLDYEQLTEPKMTDAPQTRLLVVSCVVKGLEIPQPLTVLTLAHAISSVKPDRKSVIYCKWFPRLSSPSLSFEDGIEAYHALLARSI